MTVDNIDATHRPRAELEADAFACAHQCCCCFARVTICVGLTKRSAIISQTSVVSM